MDVRQQRESHSHTINDPASQTQGGRTTLPLLLVFLLVLAGGAVAEQRGGSSVLSPDEAARRLRALGVPAEQVRRAVAALPADSLPADPVRTTASEELLPESPPPPPPEPLPLGPSGLPYFGYEVFRAGRGAFEESEAGPADPEYLIGTDDVLRITVWGQAEFQHELGVDREGRIFIPTVGQFPIAGTTLREATEKLTRTMARSYAGLVARPPTVWLDLSLARLRPKRVFIMGEVGVPGAYTVHSNATVFTSLFAVGGPAVTGSLREVRVLRNNAVAARVDLYDYLAAAEGTRDIRVQTNDVIVVPARGRTVSIRGAVRRAGIYELRGEEGLADLLKFAGGILPTAYDVTAQIDRILPPGRRTGGVEDRRVVDVPLPRVLAGNTSAGGLEDGDDVRIFEVLDEKRNYVTVEGAVWRPGRYELSTVRTVRQLIASAQGVHPSAYPDLAHLTRVNPDRVTRTLLAFDLGMLVEDSTGDIDLLPQDEVMVYSRAITEIANPFVTIRGSVKTPGRYPLARGTTLRDLLAVAGGYTENVDLLEAEISRVRGTGLLGDTLAIVLHPALPVRPTLADGDASGGAVPLQHRDEVLIRPNPYYATQKNISVSGDVMYPGIYSLRRRGELLSEVLERAGGPTRTSSMVGAEFYRNGRRLILDFREAYARRNPLHDVTMLDGDSIYIPSKPHTVLVTGEVNNPGLLSFIQGEDVQDYITRAGGLTDSASYAVLVQPTGESRRVDFGFLRSSPEVEEGAAIEVRKVPPPPPEVPGMNTSETVKDVFAILTSAATLAFIVWQVTR